MTDIGIEITGCGEPSHRYVLSATTAGIPTVVTHLPRSKWWYDIALTHLQVCAHVPVALANLLGAVSGSWLRVVELHTAHGGPVRHECYMKSRAAQYSTGTILTVYRMKTRQAY